VVEAVSDACNRAWRLSRSLRVNRFAQMEHE
jgi:hypothetical protein